MTNPMLRPVGATRFLTEALVGRSAFPAYYANMAAINRAGPRSLRGRALPGALSVELVEAFVQGGGWVVDGRHRFSFAHAHIPRSVNIELGPDFGPRVGAVVPFNEPLVLVLPEPVDGTLTEGVTQLARIGFDRVLGYVDGGLDAWREAGKGTDELETVRARDIAAASGGSKGPLIVDVRERWEWESGHVPGSLSIPLAELPARISEIPAGRDLIVVCAAGRRAAVASSLLQRAGRRPRFLAAGGAPNLLDRAG
jgi:hydroxyacylglutathione hydrolase